MAKLLSCVLGPRLYRVYRDRGPGPHGRRDAQHGRHDAPRGRHGGAKHADSVLALVS
uniref:Uncharacterized protein n=1 Tax=Apteryx owenii TaxID=8824 RepID=A0A8B9PD26_APTOW